MLHFKLLDDTRICANVTKVFPVHLLDIVWRFSQVLTHVFCVKTYIGWGQRLGYMSFYGSWVHFPVTHQHHIFTFAVHQLRQRHAFLSRSTYSVKHFDHIQLYFNFLSNIWINKWKNIKPLSTYTSPKICLWCLSNPSSKAVQMKFWAELHQPLYRNHCRIGTNNLSYD